MSAQPKTRPRGFAPWTPRTDTLALLQQVRGVLAEYEEHLPLTIRQVFYRLVGAHGYDKTEQAYSRLCEAMGRARRAGHIPFQSIRDDGGSRLGNAGWAGPEPFLNWVANYARTFQLDRQHGQDVQLWVLCEAAGMAPMLARQAGPYGVPVLSSGGFDSLTAKHDLAHELAGVRRAEVLHIGDHDPSGVHIFAALRDDVSAMVKSLGGLPPTFTRLAVTLSQAEALGLPACPLPPPPLAPTHDAPPPDQRCAPSWDRLRGQPKDTGPEGGGLPRSSVARNPKKALGPVTYKAVVCDLRALETDPQPNWFWPGQTDLILMKCIVRKSCDYCSKSAPIRKPSMQGTQGPIAPV